MDETDFCHPWAYSDVVLQVEGRKLYANKTILSMWSPVFEGMVGDHVTGETCEPREIHLAGKRCDDVLEMLRVLHPPYKKLCGRPSQKIVPGSTITKQFLT